MNRTGAELVREALESLGVRHTFGIPGVHNTEIYDQLAMSPTITPVLVAHEGGAAFMADAVSRVGESVGTLVVVPAAGLTHAASGIGEAYLDGIPMLVISGGVRRDTGRRYQLHDVDQHALLRPITKGTWLVRSHAEIVPAIRAALDAAGHPALLLVDTISSLGCMPFRMDDWGVDVTVGGSQKGLMLPTGVSFTGVSEKAMAAHKQARMPRAYFDWTAMAARRHKSFIGTVPIAMFYGLKESIRLIEEEGLDAVHARHHRLAEAVRRAIRVWSGNGGPQIYCTDPQRVSDSVTTILMPDGCNAEAVRAVAIERFNTMTGGGLARLSGKVFRIGHMGDLNEPMVLGALASVEMSLRIAGVPYQAGGVAAAMEYLAETAVEDQAKAA